MDGHYRSVIKTTQTFPLTNNRKLTGPIMSSHNSTNLVTSKDKQSKIVSNRVMMARVYYY